jgi:hypothetical protein
MDKAVFPPKLSTMFLQVGLDSMMACRHFPLVESPVVLQVTTVLFLSLIFSLNSNNSAEIIILIIEDRRM